MPYKNFYYTNENLLFTVFYGTVSSTDMRSYAMEMFKQKVVREGFSRITDGTLVKEIIHLPNANVVSTVSLKAMEGVVRSNDGVIVSCSDHVDALAEKFVSENKRHGDTIHIRRTLDEALDFYGISNLKDKLQSHIDLYRVYFPVRENVSDEI